MPTEYWLHPDTDGGGATWFLTGGLKVTAVASDDGDTTRITNSTPNGTDLTGNTQVFSALFSGLPVDALIPYIALRVSAQSGDGIAHNGGLKFTGSGAFGTGALSVPATYLLTPNELSAGGGSRLGLGVTVPGSGQYTGQVSFYPGSGQPNGASIRITEVLIGILVNQSPTAPTSLTPANGSSPGTLVPTFTGTHNDPDGDALGGVEFEVRRVSDNALMWASGLLSASGTTFSVGYSGSALTSGVQYQFRARTYDNSGLANSAGAWSNFQTFTPVINNPPTATQVSPVASATVTPTPTLVFTFSDPDAGDTLSGYQLQVRRQSDQVSFWDTGVVAASGSTQNIAYAGTALANGVTYEWRVRVQDSHGALSSYTSWSAFTVQNTPNIPTGLTPSGLASTLTPTISGTYNQGSGGTEAGYQYEIRQGATTIYQSGDVAGAFGTGQAYGTNNPSDTPATPPALGWGVSYQIRARSKDNNSVYSDWSSWQSFNTNAAPNAPSNLTPSGGSILGSTTPTLTWQHNDPDGDAQTAAQIYLYDITASGYVAGYNPKTLSQSAQSHTVTTALTLTHQYQWRLQTQGLAGPGYGPLSTWAVFNVATAPTVSITAPTGGQVYGTPSNAVTWSMSGGSGVQQDYQVQVLAADQSTVIYDSGIQSGAAVTWTVPAGYLRNNQTYYVQVTVHDTLNQLATSSKVMVTTSWTLPATIAGLLLQLISGPPALPLGYLTWTQTSEPVASFLFYSVYRKLATESAYTRIAKITDRTVTYYQDDRLPANVSASYYVTITKDVTGDQVESAAPAIVSGTLTFQGAFLHEVGYLQNYAYLREAQGRQLAQSQDIKFVQLWDRARPVAHVGRPLSQRLKTGTYTSYPTDKTLIAMLEQIQSDQFTLNVMLCYRNTRGRRLFCQIAKLGETEQVPFSGFVDIELQEVDYTEAV